MAEVSSQIAVASRWSGGPATHVLGIAQGAFVPAQAMRDWVFGVDGADYASAVVYLTSQAHHAVEKALHIAGMGEAPVRQVRPS